VLPEHGRLLVVEEVLAAPNQPGGKVMDLLMAAVGGRERTWQEWGALLRPAPAQAQTVVTTRPTPQRRDHRAVGLRHPGAEGNRPGEWRVLPGGRAQRHRRQPAAPTWHGHVLQHRHHLLIPQGSAAPSMLVVVVVVVNGC
jgi:hypothetical protein